MKYLFWVFFCIFLLRCICCNENILSKFHQNGYKLKDVRIQLIDYDHDFYDVFEFKPFKYNRTTTAHNMTLRVKQIDPKDDIEILIQVYKFLSNEYRHFPVRFQVNLNKCFKANVIGFQSIRKCGNLTSFYFYKNVTYHVCNFVPDEKHLPPRVPNGRYKIDAIMLYFNKEVARLNGFAEVHTPIEYPKN